MNQPILDCRNVSYSYHNLSGETLALSNLSSYYKFIDLSFRGYRLIFYDVGMDELLDILLYPHS